jgi:hypothetical protein
MKKPAERKISWYCPCATQMDILNIKLLYSPVSFSSYSMWWMSFQFSKYILLPIYCKTIVKKGASLPPMLCTAAILLIRLAFTII